MEDSHFDYVIIGAGCSGWQLAHALMQHQELKSKKIAICDDGIKQSRSWCFWSEDDSIFPDLVQKSWSNLKFAAPYFQTSQHLDRYKYNYISGDAFFNYFNTQFLTIHSNVNLIQNAVETVKKNENGFEVIFDNKETIQSDFVFDSRIPSTVKKGNAINLWQHFRGWFVETDSDSFDETTATLMDFTISQEKEVRFMYVLPFSKRLALIECTAFSEDVFDFEVYDTEIKTYLQDYLKIKDFRVTEKESGKIPMTNFSFQKTHLPNYWNIGTNSGAVKPTTGYAFKRIHSDSQLIAKSLARSEPLKRFISAPKYVFYDNLLLKILNKEPHRGVVIFKALFKRIKMKQVIRFLDEKTNIWEDISIFSSLPWYPFLKYLVRK